MRPEEREEEEEEREEEEEEREEEEEEREEEEGEHVGSPPSAQRRPSASTRRGTWGLGEKPQKRRNGHCSSRREELLHEWWMEELLQ